MYEFQPGWCGHQAMYNRNILGGKNVGLPASPEPHASSTHYPPSRWTVHFILYSGSVGQRLRDDGNLHPLTLSSSSKINGYLYPQRVSPRLKNNYLCTYNLYGPVRNAFDAGSIRYMGKWEGVVPGNREFFGPCEMASTDRRVPFGAQKTRD
jgi:hypothetical protein